MFGLTSLFRPLVAQPTMLLTRNLMKTHKGAAKRWIKSANGFKRSKAGKNHGNAGWSKSTLQSLTGRARNNSAQTKRLNRLMPYA